MPAAAPLRVLVVEDEAVLRVAMARGLGKLPGIEVVTAGSVGEALGTLDSGPPALVISDIDLPDRVGLELIGELRGRGLNAPIVFVSAYVRAYRSQIPPHARVEVLEKPLSIEQLRAIVQDKLGAAPEPYSPFSVPDFLQLAGLGRHSVAIEISGPAKGRIVINNGEVWHAQDERGAGLDAFCRLALAQGVAVRCVTLRGDPGPRALQGSAESLLLEAARRSDEAQRGAPAPSTFTELEADAEELLAGPPRRATPLPAPADALAAQATPRPGATTGEASFDELVDQGIQHVMAKRFAEALRVFEAAKALKPEDKRIEANLQRLRQLLSAPT